MTLGLQIHGTHAFVCQKRLLDLVLFPTEPGFNVRILLHTVLQAATTY